MASGVRYQDQTNALDLALRGLIAILLIGACIAHYIK